MHAPLSVPSAVFDDVRLVDLFHQTGHLLTWSEDRSGSIEVGKDADLVVLGGNPLTCPEDAIKDVSVDLTLVGGRIVHDRQTPGG